MLTCEDCACFSELGRGWIALQVHDHEKQDAAEVVTYCPPCAWREFEFTPRILVFT